MAKLDSLTRARIAAILRRHRASNEPVSPAAVRRRLQAHGWDASERTISRMAIEMSVPRGNGPEVGAGGRPTGDGKKFSVRRPKILAAIAKGKTNKEIASALDCTSALVSIYRRELKKNT